MSQPNPTLIYMTYRCFYDEKCNKEYSAAQWLREHLKSKHDFVFPSQMTKGRRRCSEQFVIVPKSCKHAQQHFSCPGCTTCHFADLNDLDSHFRVVHGDLLPDHDQENTPISSSSGQDESVTPSTIDYSNNL
ncbi:hypothetical protein DM01DRAFT_1276582, partial [Hesseltinella vesiculosa]